jgi:23S rRNA (uracil1939-C5)-methyltransferase
MRRNKPKILNGITIEKIAAEGKGLGRVEGKVVFVDYAVPGDVVDVFTTKNKKDFASGNIFKLITPSAKRIVPKCAHFMTCGGCRWQHVSYQTQLDYKQTIVEEAFNHIAKMENINILPIVGNISPFYYRNKMDFTFTNRRWLKQEEIDKGEDIVFERRGIGMHVFGRFEAVEHINNCMLMEDGHNSIRNSLYDFAIKNDYSFYNVHSHEGLLRNLILRNTIDGQIMLLLVVGQEDMPKINLILEYLKTYFPNINNILYAINSKKNDTIYDLDIQVYKGEKFITETLGNKKFHIDIKSFFQTNSTQAKELYDITKQYADLDKEDIVYDLYTGTGSIAIYVADSCKKVVGIELVEASIVDAKRNALINNIDNCSFFASAAEQLFDKDFIEINGMPDVVITDPPRAGMHPKVIETLITFLPKKIVYVSCNAATQARDIALLQEFYVVDKIQPVDMFPQTHHVESVALLIRK